MGQQRRRDRILEEQRVVYSDQPSQSDFHNQFRLPRHNRDLRNQLQQHNKRPDLRTQIQHHLAIPDLWQQLRTIQQSILPEQQLLRAVPPSPILHDLWEQLNTALQKPLPPRERTSGLPINPSAPIQKAPVQQPTRVIEGDRR